LRRFPALALSALIPSCAYDWSIGPVADAGPGGGGSSTGSTTTTGSTTSSSTTVPDCPTLLVDLETARQKAKLCTVGAAGACTASIVDECHCTSYVATGGSAEASAFAAAVQKVGAAGCTPTCSTCLPSTGACLYTSGMGPYCVP
jgi:hypothetical protein